MRESSSPNTAIGSGKFVSDFLDYEEVPRDLAEKIAAARAAEKQE